MLKYGNKDFLNLQEQVYKNMKDIQDINQGTTILAEFGIKVVGEAETPEGLPDPTTYDGEYGDAYVVGEEAPYDYYIFTRPFSGETEDQWFNLGEFPVPGPQGEQGEQGPVGATPIIDMTVSSVSTLNPGQSATVSISKAGTMTNPLFKVSFGIPQGAQGVNGTNGAQGPTGPQGPKGDKGDKGDTGGLIEVVGIIASADNLPDPVTLDKLDAAYLVGTSSSNYHLYIQVGETTATALWTDVGLFNVGTVVTVGGDVVQTFDADTKLDKVSGNAENVVYAQTTSAPTTVVYKEAVGANTIPLRDSNGQIKVPTTPTSSDHAASKGYVDTATASLLPTQHAGDLIVGTSTANVATRLAIGSAGQVLTVNSDANGLEYTTVSTVPAYTSSDYEKTLRVNSLGTALEWHTPSVSWSDITQKPTFAAVASTGSYNDLTNKPTIPDAVSGVNDGTNWTSITIGSTTKNIPGGVPALNGTQQSYLLGTNYAGNSYGWYSVAYMLRNGISGASAGKVLACATMGQCEWVENLGVPTYESSDANKVLTVNSLGTATEWAEGLPAHSSADVDKVLSVNSSGNTEWKSISAAAASIDVIYINSSTSTTSGTLTAAELAKIVDHPQSCVIRKYGSAAKYQQDYELTEIEWTDDNQDTISTYTYELVQNSSATAVRGRKIVITASTGAWTFSSNTVTVPTVQKYVTQTIRLNFAVANDCEGVVTSNFGIKSTAGVQANSSMSASQLHTIAQNMATNFPSGTDGSTTLTRYAAASGYFNDLANNKSYIVMGIAAWRSSSSSYGFYLVLSEITSSGMGSIVAKELPSSYVTLSSSTAMYVANVG